MPDRNSFECVSGLSRNKSATATLCRLSWWLVGGHQRFVLLLLMRFGGNPTQREGGEFIIDQVSTDFN